MRPLYSKLFQYVFALILLFCFTKGNCQVRTELVGNNIEDLEAAIGKKETVQIVQDKLEVLKQRGIGSKDDILMARSMYDLMRVRDMRTEDSLYFRNSAFMDTILNSAEASTGLKAIFHILHAQRLNNFDHRPLKFNLAAYRTKELKFNYAALSPKQRDSIVIKDVETAIKDHPFPSAVSKLLWLSSNPDVFLFEPKFEDIVLSEGINLTVGRYYDYYLERSQLGQWVALPSARFRQLLDSLASSQGGRNNVLGGYDRWLSFNKADQPVAMFIESLARKYIYLSLTQDSVSRQGYISYLLASSTSPYPAFRAHSVYQLCLIWNEQGNQYVNFMDRYRFLTGNNFDSRYQYLPQKALQLYEQNKDLIKRYSLFSKVLTLMKQQILDSGIKVEMEDMFIPGEAIPIKAIYKNKNTLYYRIVRISMKESAQNRRKATSELLDRESLAKDKFILPLPDDHNNHAAYLKLPPLAKGYYCLVFTNTEIKYNTDYADCIPFQVTDIAAVNTDERVYILNRKTGLPLTGASIALFRNKINIANGFTLKAKRAGYTVIPENKADSIVIAYRGDTLGQRFTVHTNTLPDDIYDKDEYVGLADFYNDKLIMHLFTDRSIYRPGQTVHYKAIFLTKDPYSGAPVLFNHKTLGSAFFKNRLNKWYKDNQSLLMLEDPFGRKTDSMKAVINEFGSFAGSFTLSKAAATGDWKIDGGADIDNRNSGEFKVEEYKRPTIELGMEKQMKMLMPGEPFVIKLKLRSFTGADLGDIPIRYKVSRYGELPASNAIYERNYKEEKLIDTERRTARSGELLIPIDDSLLSRLKFHRADRYSYTYNISATAVDATGESSEIDESFTISTRPIRINIDGDAVYDQQALRPLNVRTSNDFEGSIGRQVNIKLYQVSDPDAYGTARKEVDQWYYSKTDWNSWFPLLAQAGEQPEKLHTLVLDTIINTGTFQKLVLPKGKLGTGFYELEAVCEDNDKILGESTKWFKVFDSATGEVPADDIDYLPVNSVKPGDTITWFSSSKSNSYTVYQVLYETGNKHKMIKNIYKELNENKGLRRWTYHIPSDATGNVMLTRISVLNNSITQHQKTIYLYKAASEPPEIIIERYRKVMAPGSQETFTVSVKTKNDNIAAELMTTMYDASLDKLEHHTWDLPRPEYDRLYLRTYWDYSITATRSAGDYGQNFPLFLTDEIETKGAPGAASGLSGRVSGLSVTDASGLNEVVVVGYGTVKSKNLSASVTTVMIRGNRSLADYQQPLIVLDGVVYNGNLQDIASSAITQAVVLKGADAAAIYGSSGSQGVLIISTKGPIILPGTEEPVIKVRKNFNETAFFFPQVHADADGYYHFSFTMPETTTEWNWKILAHTRNAQFAYLERKLQTQLNLMVQPNMPRVLYQGDKINLRSRITNLDTTAVAGKITCKVEDAVTGQDITSVLVTGNEQNFRLDKKSTNTSPFLLTVPPGQSNPLKVVISVTGGGASDAEEHIIPVLSTRVFTRQSIQLHFKDNSPISIRAVKLPADASFYGIGISIRQKPQASLINALPWLANYSYDCAEQTFNKLRANVTALRLMQKDTTAQKAFKRASLSIDNAKPGPETLPDELQDESLPWLNIAEQSFRQQKQLFHLLDTGAAKINISQRLEKLYKLQQADGGLTWFEGGKSNDYISSYVLAGFGQLKQQGWKTDPNMTSRQQDFISKLFKYNEKMVMLTKPGYFDLYALYTTSYWPELQDASLVEKANLMLDNAWQNVSNFPLEQQALLIINTIRYTKNGSALYQKGQQQLVSIRQLAITDADNGLRWKDIADGENLNSSAEETIALLSEAFGLGGKDNDVDSGILRWLLTTKQDQHWQTTKATSAAIVMLQKQNGTTFGADYAFTAEWAGEHLSVSNGLLDGVPNAFAAIRQSPATITLQQNGVNTNGAITWYYFAEPQKLDTLNKGIRISKQFYRYDKVKGWVVIADGTSLKVGENVRAKLTIDAASMLKFVHISDPRAAAFEPKDNNSGYQYNDGLSYYRSVKDTGLELFLDSVPRGISEISYEIVVAMDGQFTSGPARLQCMYLPSVTSYSNAQKFMSN